MFVATRSEALPDSGHPLEVTVPGVCRSPLTYVPTVAASSSKPGSLHSESTYETVLIFFFNLDFIYSISGLPACVPGAHRGQKRVSHPLELELQM